MDGQITTKLFSCCIIPRNRRMWTHKRVNMKNKPNPAMCTRANMKARTLVFTTGRNTHWERTKGNMFNGTSTQADVQHSRSRANRHEHPHVSFFPNTIYTIRSATALQRAGGTIKKRKKAEKRIGRDGWYNSISIHHYSVHSFNPPTA